MYIMKTPTSIILIVILNINIIKAQISSKAIKINNEAFDLLSEGKYEDAVIGFNNAISIDSNYYLSYQNRAYVYSILGNDSNAINDYNKAIELNPEVADMYYSLANIYQKKKLYEQAYNNYSLAINTAVKNNDKSNLYIYYFNRGNNLLERERYKESIVDFDSTEMENSDFNDIFLNRGISKYKIKDLEGACVDWYIALKYDLPNAKKYFDKYCDTTIVNKYLQLPEFPGGLIEFRRYIGNNLKYPVYYRNKGEQGTVFVRFKIKADGNIEILDVYSFVSQDLSIEAFNSITASKEKWKVATIKGKKVDFTFSIPVTFRLDKGDNFPYNKKKAYQNFEKGNYREAKKYLHNYLRWNFDTTAVKDYVKIKYLLNDTVDIEYYKYMAGISDKKPDFLKTYSKHTNINNNFLIAFSSETQNKPNEIKTLYYNNKYELTDNKDFFLYRVSAWNPNILFFDSTFTDYNKNNNIIHTGSYSQGFKEGLFKVFYNDTNVLYAEGKYKKNKMNGLWKYYYKSGKIKDEVVIMGNEFKIINHYSENGDTLVKIGNGKWIFQIRSWDGKNDMLVSGNLLNGMKDGLWIVRNDKKVVVEENYEKGKFISGKYYEKKKATKTSEPLITSWIFINTALERMGSLLLSDSQIKKSYPYIRFPN